jgi:hypothetical protein
MVKRKRTNNDTPQYIDKEGLQLYIDFESIFSLETSRLFRNFGNLQCIEKVSSRCLFSTE